MWILHRMALGLGIARNEHLLRVAREQGIFCNGNILHAGDPRKKVAW